MSFSEEVRRAITGAVEKTSRYPFLFIGSGISRRYLGTPSWEELLRRVCDEVIGDRFAYARYLSEAKTAVEREETDSVFPYVATLMEREVNTALLTKEEFEGFRVDNEEWLQAGGSPLKRYVADILGGFGTICDSEECGLLVEAGRSKVSGVITTNYDGLCEAMFPDFVPYVGEDGILFRDPTFAQEIYEIHGSVRDPQSLVLTEADYARFSDRQKYLAAKLLTIFAEYPVIFLGYSMQDANVRSILSSIAKCVGPGRLEDLGDRLMFVRWEPGTEASVTTQLMTFEGQAVGMTGIVTDDFSDVYRAISASQRLYDVRALRELSGSIFSIVRRLDAKSQTVVASMDKAIDTLGENDKVVIGFGEVLSDYGRSIGLLDLYRDVVLGDSCFPEALVAYEYLETLLKHNSNAVPVFKYLAAVGISDDDLETIGPKLCEYVRKHDSIASYLSDSQVERKEKYRASVRGALSIDGLIEMEGADRAFQFVKYMDEDEIDVYRLGSYLASMLVDGNGSVSLEMLETDTYKSEFKKCVRIFDFMRYRYGKSLGLL